jgi:HTH-type transcriptional regulator/antitoxin HigA
MGAALKLIEEEVFKNTSAYSPGPLYDALMDHFPISQIESLTQLRTANQVLSSLISILQRITSPKGEIAQINLYVQSLAQVIQKYEELKFARTKTSGCEMLAHLMEIHGLKQTDLSKELGGQSIVSSILRGKRELNKKQIQNLAKRFHVSPETFFDR